MPKGYEIADTYLSGLKSPYIALYGYVLIGLGNT